MNKIMLGFLAVVASSATLRADDWPTYMKDGARSGVSTDELVAGLSPVWVYDPGVAPSPGFYPKAVEKKEQNIGQQGTIVQTITYDYAYAPVVAAGKLYFGSSSQEGLFCIDAKSGQKLWSFFAEGAVRFAPVVVKGRAYFGSDDGCVYCLDAATGKLVWKFNAAPEDRRIIANGRMASQWPIRTSLALNNGTLYFSAGLFPASGGVYLYALKADTGEQVWRKGSLSPSQGYILAAEDLLFVPNGRASPTEFRQADGSTLVSKFDMRRSGGSSFAGMLDDMVVYGPSEYGVFHFRAEKSEVEIKGMLAGLDRIMHGKITGLTGWRVAKKGDTACFLADSQLMALPYEPFKKSLLDSANNFMERSKSKAFTTKSGVQQTGDSIAMKEMEGYARWTAKLKGARALIIAGNTAIAGCDGWVKGFDLESGTEKFSFPVDGTAWELAAAEGHLYASTSSGKIYCFGPATKTPREIKAITANVFQDADQAKFKALAALGLKKAGRSKGYCLIVGAGDGRLAYEIVKNSDMQVICAEKNLAVAAKARENLVRAGVYGRAVVHLCEDGKLPYIQYFANLILSESLASGSKMDFSGADVYECLQPYGGALVLSVGKDAFPDVKDWQSEKAGAAQVVVHVRGDLPGAGEWSHMFANPQNTSSSGDRLITGTDYLVQWFGDPGTIESAGWHYDGMGPLAKDGKLVNIKAYSVECVDAYNGTRLWYKAMPEVLRLNAAREGGSGCMDEKNLYLAVKNDCQVLDLISGKSAGTYLGPDTTNDWGFIAVAGSRLFGSKQNPKTTATAKYDRKDLKQLWNVSEPDLAVSSSFFALDKKTGATLWNYAKTNMVLLNSSMTIGEKAVYWVESRSPVIVADGDGSVGLVDFFSEDAFLVAVDIQTGKPIWEIPFQSKAQGMFYLSLYKGMLIETASYHVGPLAGKRYTAAGFPKGQETYLYFSFRAFDADTGKMKWASGYASKAMVGHQHNYNISHPVIVGNFLYNNPAEQYFAKVNLETGAVTENKSLQRSKGCNTPTGSEYAMFFRSLGIGGIDFATEKPFYVSDVSRPACWMNILPTCGLVMIPEYSFGCMCGFPLQTSIVFAPGKLAAPVEVKRQVGGPAVGLGDK